MDTNKKILIVDDDMEALAFLREILEQEKFEVLEALTAEQALEILESEQTDLVISDLKMHGMSGIDLLGELRRWEGSLPVIFISGWKNDKIWKDAQDTDASSVIGKPFKKNTIIKAVFKALQEQESFTTPGV